jgi:hypothetical protein
MQKCCSYLEGTCSATSTNASPVWKRRSEADEIGHIISGLLKDVGQVSVYQRRYITCYTCSGIFQFMRGECAVAGRGHVK